MQCYLPDIKSLMTTKLTMTMPCNYTKHNQSAPLPLHPLLTVAILMPVEKDVSFLDLLQNQSQNLCKLITMSKQLSELLDTILHMLTIYESCLPPPCNTSTVAAYQKFSQTLVLAPVIKWMLFKYTQHTDNPLFCPNALPGLLLLLPYP